MTDFDAYARDYKALHNQSIRLSGESGEYFADYKLQVLRRFCTVNDGDLVVDYGCGIGMLTGRLAGEWPRSRILGFDPSQESLKQAAQAVAGYANIRLTDSLDGARGGAALAVCANVLHHVEPRERVDVVAQLASVLAPGGRLVIFEHNPLNPLTRQSVAACPFDEGVTLLPRGETLGYVERTGLQVVRKDYIVFFPAALRALRPLEPSLAWAPLGAQYCIQAVRAGSRNGAQ